MAWIYWVIFLAMAVTFLLGLAEEKNGQE